MFATGLPSATREATCILQLVRPGDAASASVMDGALPGVAGGF
jgi:hypothetical protein